MEHARPNDPRRPPKATQLVSSVSDDISLAANHPSIPSNRFYHAGANRSVDTGAGPDLAASADGHSRRSMRSESSSARRTRVGQRVGPERSTKGRYVAVCQELSGFWPGYDPRLAGIEARDRLSGQSARPAAVSWDPRGDVDGVHRIHAPARAGPERGPGAGPVGDCLPARTPPAGRSLQRLWLPRPAGPWCFMTSMVTSPSVCDRRWRHRGRRADRVPERCRAGGALAWQ